MLEVAILWTGVIALFLLGLIGIFVPVVPGIGLVFGGVLLYAIATEFETISSMTVIVFGVVTLLAWLADYAGAAIGAKYGGGKVLTVIGSMLGALLGLIFGGPVGIFVGAFVGALGGALYEGQTMDKASRAAIYSVVGMLGATIVQVILAISIIVAFTIVIVV